LFLYVQLTTNMGGEENTNLSDNFRYGIGAAKSRQHQQGVMFRALRHMAWQASKASAGVNRRGISGWRVGGNVAVSSGALGGLR